MLRSAGRFRMLLWIAAMAVISAPFRAAAQPGDSSPGEPTNPQARKLFAEATNLQVQHQPSDAIQAYLAANKQEVGGCFECIHRAYMLAVESGDFATARAAVNEGLPQAPSDGVRALMHYWLGIAWQRQGIHNGDRKSLLESCREFKAALKIDPSLTPTLFSYGVSLARLHRDKEARAQFEAFLAQDQKVPSLHARARRFADNVELARARMAPAFSITTLDGRHLSLDSLAGKVVLVDFWATWCPPCVAELPELRTIVQEYQGKPFVLLSVSMDEDVGQWKKFVALHHMTWPQFHDGDAGVSLAALFGVHKIPFTFSINAEGVVEDQHLGENAHIDAALKELVAQAVAQQRRSAQAATAPAP